MSTSSSNVNLLRAMFVSAILIVPLGLIYSLFYLLAGKRKKFKWIGKVTLLAFLFYLFILSVLYVGAESIIMWIVYALWVIGVIAMLVESWDEIEKL